MNVLVACEESQTVCKAFREKGHEAYSCDIIECSGGHPEWHIKGDVLPLLNREDNGNNGWHDIYFSTMDGKNHSVEKWDLIIAHPPCTYLTNAGTRHFSLKCSTPEKVAARLEMRKQAAEFFMMFVNADCEYIAIENPVGYMNTVYRKADQIIHPYYFAESENDSENYYQKRTCLWLKNLKPLERKLQLEKPKPKYICQGEKCKGKPIGWCEGISGITGGQAGRAKARSKTFEGVAKAMAEKWG
ncbi:MAG: hypothetical protein IJW55_07435 [Clostridia bacterium]|nr:hypothetical protein [Clostridia bacterium]